MPICLVARAPYSAEGVVAIAQWGKFSEAGNAYIEVKPLPGACSLPSRNLGIRPVSLPEGAPLMIANMMAFGGGILLARSTSITGQIRTAGGELGVLAQDAWPSTEGASTPGALGAARLVSGLRAAPGVRPIP